MTLLSLAKCRGVAHRASLSERQGARPRARAQGLQDKSQPSSFGPR